MNKASAFFALFFVIVLSVGRSQEIKRLVPWSNAPDQAEMGMSARDFKTMLPTISPLMGMFDGYDPKESEVIKDGMYASGPDGNDYSETVVYGIGGGRVTQFYWSSKKMVSLADVVNFRRKLSEMHGNPRVGYKARVTKDGIAKIITEIYNVLDTNLVISISSALGSTEVAVLDKSDPKVDLNELYFSFDKQRDRLQKELLRLTKNTPKDEADADSLDVLREAISADSKETSREQSNQGAKPKEKPDDKSPRIEKNGEKTIEISADESSGWSKKSIILTFVAVVALSLILLIIRKTNQKR